MDLRRIPTYDTDGAIHVVIESPRGSPVKLKFEPKAGVFTVSRPLVLGVRYPYDWGFVPQTRAPDGDPVDAMVLWDVPSYPGVLIPCRALAVVRIEQNRRDKKGRERNDRILAVPTAARRSREIETLEDLPQRLRQELESFFHAVTALEDKNIEVLGWDGRADAEALVRESTKPSRAQRKR
jgi:inorganic pyrophosphatase